LAKVSATDIKDRESLEAWLNELPELGRREVAIAIAHRSAMRVLPLLHTFKKNQKSIFIFQVFRCNIIARVAREGPTREIVDAGYAACADYIDADAYVGYAYVAADAAAAASYIAAYAAAAATYVPTYVSDIAEAASATAASAFSAYSIWENTRNDCFVIESGNTPAVLLKRQLWYSEVEWFQDALTVFETQLNSPPLNEDQWGLWLEWYKNIIQGSPAFSNTGSQSEALERRIALGDGRPDFWDRPAAEVNAEIKSWVEAARVVPREPQPEPPVFISYNVDADLDQAKKIGVIVDEIGFEVFAQYKNMPAGSNFVAEMQKGLASMGKFVPLYSPEYIAAPHCQAEWNAAYAMDPVGERRLITAFLLRKTELPPLHKQIIFVPLYGLTTEKAREAIIEALSNNGTLNTKAKSRSDALEQAVPVIGMTADGKLTAERAIELEQAFIDDELVHLPNRMRSIISILLEALELKNAPAMVKSNLRGYLRELDINGGSARAVQLSDCMDFINAEISEVVNDGWNVGGIKLGLERLNTCHLQFLQNFPLMMIRDIKIKQANIDTENFDSEDFKKAAAGIAATSPMLVDGGLALQNFNEAVHEQQRLIKDLASIIVPQQSDRFLPNSKEVQIDDLKKSVLFRMSGFADGTLNRAEKVASFADSELGKQLIGYLKTIAKSIWN
jgi:TIR domain